MNYEMKMPAKRAVQADDSLLNDPSITIFGDPQERSIFINVREEGPTTSPRMPLGLNLELTPKQAKDLAFSISKALYEATFNDDRRETQPSDEDDGITWDRSEHHGPQGQQKRQRGRFDPNFRRNK